MIDVVALVWEFVSLVFHSVSLRDIVMRLMGSQHRARRTSPHGVERLGIPVTDDGRACQAGGEQAGGQEQPGEGRGAGNHGFGVTQG